MIKEISVCTFAGNM